MTAGGGQRRDVVANRARIVAAATRMLHEQGLSADMRSIAAEAGVGIGTLYRHFPTREDLVREITSSDLSGLAAASLPPDETAINALRGFFTSALSHLANNRAMIDLLANSKPSDTELTRCLRHLRALGQEAVDRSKEDHTLAADITATDVSYRLLGLVRVVQLMAPDESVDIDHQVDVTLRGLEPRQSRSHSEAGHPEAGRPAS